MEKTDSPNSTVRFGVFEVDPRSGELRKAGMRVRVEHQPFRVLLALLENPGELVTREELRRRIWPTESFGDFDHALNKAVAKLRTALGDSADVPRYVETLHRRGYRFVFPVGAANGNERALPAEAESSLLSKRGTDIKRARVWITATILGVVVVGTVEFSLRNKAPKLTTRDTIVLADFANMTGDSVFDSALKQALAVELGQSPFLNVLSEEKISETLPLMDRPANEYVDASVGREICLRTGSTALVAGRISSIGSRYLIDIRAIACGTGDNLAQEQAEAIDRNDVLRALSRASAKLRLHLGESLPSVQKFDVPFEATTSSLEALRSYSMGNAIRRTEGDAPGIPFLKRAIELDPNFALAYAGLATSYSHLYQSSLALESAAKAYQLRDSVSEREKLRISAAYFVSRKDLEHEALAYQLWIADYPRDAVPHASLSANYMSMGQYDKALAEGGEALRLAPDDVVNYSNLAFAYLLLDKLDEAKATLDDAFALKLDGRELRWELYQVAFLREDTVEMERELTWAAGRPGAEDTLLYAQSNTEAYYGRVKKAREFNQRAVDSALRTDSSERAALWDANAALWEAEMGNAAFAKGDANAALALSRGRNVKMWAALALAQAGDISQAQTLAMELEKENPSYTMLKVLWLPTIKATIALAQGNPSNALADLRSADPYELSNNLNMLPAYLRGQAYLGAHHAAAAAAEFQKVLDHRGIARNAAWDALARLQIGRAYCMSANVAKARAAYEDFFAVWKDADPNIPILRQAKTECANLQ